jgi:hypothetical protein
MSEDNRDRKYVRLLAAALAVSLSIVGILPRQKPKSDARGQHPSRATWSNRDAHGACRPTSDGSKFSHDRRCL